MASTWKNEGVEARLTKLWTEDGLSAAKIAADLSAMTGEPITRNAVIGRIRRLGLTGKGNPDRIFGEQAVAEAPPAAAAPPPSELLRSRATAATEPLSIVEAEPEPPAAEPPDAPAPAPNAGVPLIDLRLGQCRFPVTPHHAPEHFFCADAVEGPGATYCPHHAAICFDRRTPQERRAAHERAVRARAGREAA